MEGFEIGGHTVNHVNLGSVKDREVLAEEIRLDRQRLEAWIQRPVRWFAYPFGGPKDFSSQAIDVVAEIGYEAAFTIVPGEVGTTRRFQVPRDSLDLGASERLWQAWLDGSYDLLYQLKPGTRPARSPATL